MIFNAFDFNSFGLTVIMIISLAILLLFRMASHGIVDAARIFYEEISEADGSTIVEASIKRTPMIHRSYHQCSMKEYCNYIIKNLTSNEFTLYNSEEDLPRKRTTLRIWRKVYTGKTSLSRYR